MCGFILGNWLIQPWELVKYGQAVQGGKSGREDWEEAGGPRAWAEAHPRVGVQGLARA